MNHQTDKVIVTSRQVADAVKRAGAFTDEWQAAYLEIILLEHVKPVWVAANRGRVDLTRHAAKRAFINLSGEAIRRISSREGWLEYSGYIFYCNRDVPYNEPRPTSYTHSAYIAWAGITRETVKSFVLCIRDLYLHYSSPHVTMQDWLIADCVECLDRFDIEYIHNKEKEITTNDNRTE